MKPLESIKRIYLLIVKPTSEWDNIKQERISLKDVALRIGLPLIVLASLSTFLGGYVINENFALKTTLVQSLITFTSLSISIYISSFLLNLISPKFGGTRNLNIFGSVIIYSFSVFIFTAAIADIHFTLRFFNIFGVYSLVLLWVGMKEVLKIPADKVTGFAIISFLLTIIIYTLLRFVFSLMLLT